MIYDVSNTKNYSKKINCKNKIDLTNGYLAHHNLDYSGRDYFSAKLLAYDLVLMRIYRSELLFLHSFQHLSQFHNGFLSYKQRIYYLRRVLSCTIQLPLEDLVRFQYLHHNELQVNLSHPNGCHLTQFDNSE